jgi:hypothetical protein
MEANLDAKRCQVAGSEYIKALVFAKLREDPPSIR